MLFSEALELLQQGETMCREGWSLQDGYLKLMPGMKFVWKIVLLPSPNAGNYIFALEDFLGCDWMRFEVPKEVIEAELAKAA